MTPYYEKLMQRLEAQGLIRRGDDGVQVTPEGDAYTRALIAAYPDKSKLRKLRVKQ